MTSEATRPLILVANDDGIEAQGIALLAGEMAEIGDVYVVAPAEAQSAMSQALTTRRPIRMREVASGSPYRQFAVAGTPTDCVKLALAEILPRRPDLVVSGINHGSNVSISVLYSGTLGAALEGCIAGIPSIGFSQIGREADMTPFLPYVRHIALQVLEHGLDDGVCLNVNCPSVPLQGLRICRQTRATYANAYETRLAHDGETDYHIKDTFQNLERESRDTDSWAVRHGYIAIVPVRIDMTDYRSTLKLNTWQWEL